MKRLILAGLIGLLAGCGVAAQPGETPLEPRFYPDARPRTPPPRTAGEAARDRAVELHCIREGERAEASQPWLGAASPRAAVIGARVRNACLDAYRQGRGGP